MRAVVLAVVAALAPTAASPATYDEMAREVTFEALATSYVAGRQCPSLELNQGVAEIYLKSINVDRAEEKLRNLVALVEKKFEQDITAACVIAYREYGPVARFGGGMGYGLLRIRQAPYENPNRAPRGGFLEEFDHRNDPQ